MIGVRTLFIFATEEHARRAGFKAQDLRHHQEANWIAGVPSNPDAIRGHQFGVVIVTDGVQRWAYGDMGREGRLQRLVEIAHGNLRLQPMIWMDL